MKTFWARSETAGRIVIGQALRLPGRQLFSFHWRWQYSRATVGYEESFQNPVFDPGSRDLHSEFAADKPSCQKTGKNCPMNDGKLAIAERVALASA